jgi:hypothetical protein
MSADAPSDDLDIHGVLNRVEESQVKVMELFDRIQAERESLLAAAKKAYRVLTALSFDARANDAAANLRVSIIHAERLCEIAEGREK